MSDPAIRPEGQQPVATDFWFARIDHRLGRLEAMAERTERQMTTAVWVAGAVLGVEALRVLILV